MRVKALVFGCFSLVLTSCVSSREAEFGSGFAISSDIDVGPISDVGREELIISGWLRASGEWELHPDRNLNAYYPIEAKGVVRCIPLGIGDGVSPVSAEWPKLHGNAVTLTGRLIHYEELDDSDNPVEKVLHRKYYAGRIVFNACLNTHVFIPRRILPWGN